MRLSRKAMSTEGIIVGLLVVAVIGFILIVVGMKALHAADKMGTCISPPPGLVCASNITDLKDMPEKWNSCPIGYEEFSARNCKIAVKDSNKYDVMCCFKSSPK